MVTGLENWLIVTISPVRGRFIKGSRFDVFIEKSGVIMEYDVRKCLSRTRGFIMLPTIIYEYALAY